KSGEKAMRRLLIAAILGAFILFIWGGLSHMVLLTGTGFSVLTQPQEDKLIESLKVASIKEGLYFFPAKDFHGSTSEQDASWLKRFRDGPHGLIVYRPQG